MFAKVGKQAFPLANHHHQAPLRREIMLVNFKMVGNMVDTFR